MPTLRTFLIVWCAALVVLWPSQAMAPPIIVPAIVTALGFTGVAATIASVILSIGAAFIFSTLARLIAGKPKSPTAGLGGRQDMIRQPIVARRTIYGRQMVGGPLVFAHTHGVLIDQKNAYLNFIEVLAAHECEGFAVVDGDASKPAIWFGDQRVNFQAGSSGELAEPYIHHTEDGDLDAAWVYPHLGAANQAADSVLIADAPNKWTADHRLRGLCYLHVKLLYDGEGKLFQDGIPNVRAEVKGKKLYDTRTAVTAWSDNPALCVYDYLTDVLGVAAAEIDTASVNAAANECDENVPRRSGANEARYTYNGVVESTNRPADVLANLLGSMAGELVYSGGTFFLHAGSATATTLALDEDDVVGGIVVHPRVARRELFNACKAVYVSQDKDWQPTDAPVVTSAAYKAQDAGVEIVQPLELPFTITGSMAQRLARIALERMRQQIAVDLTVNQVGLQLRAWDTVTRTNATYGWTDKKFRVVGWRLNESGNVGLTLREEADAMWDWSAADETAEDPAPDTDLPDPREVPAPGALGFIEELRATRTGVPVAMIVVSFGAADDGFAVGYELQFKKSSATRWRPVGSGSGTEYEVGPVADNVAYDFRARSVNAIGGRSSWTKGSHTVTGQTAPPADVGNFRINIVGDQAELAWDPVGDVDLHHYRIRFSSAVAGVGWTTAIDLRPEVSKAATSVAVPARVGTYLIKAVDYKGNASVNAATIVTTVPALGNLNVIQTITESPGFGGAHAGTAAPDGVLQLDTANLFESVAGNFDDANGLFDAGGGAGNIAAEGFYTFGATLDLGASYYPNRASAALEATTIDHASTFDDAPGNFDDREGQFDGSVGGEVAVELQTRTTDDDPGGAPVWSAWRPFDVGDFKARAMQFRARVTSTNVQASPGITALSVTIDMPDRVVEQHDLVIPAAGLGITFPSGAFKAVPALGVSVQDGASGDRLAITAKTAAGFTLRVFDSGGSGVARTADYVARGYGVAA